MGARRLTMRIAPALVGVTFGMWMALASVALAEPIAPVIGEEHVSDVSDTRVVFEAVINPGSTATTYHVEYGTSSSYGESVPSPDASIGSGEEGVPVGAGVEQLASGTTYHYRFVAVNASGATYGLDRTFTTYSAPVATTDNCPNAQTRGSQAASYLPECRAYEMVSPIDKKGGNISASPSNSRAAVDGNAVQYLSVTGFADAYGVGGFGTEYIAQRASEGWFTHAITPSQLANGLTATNVKYQGDFSDDLNAGVLFSISPLKITEPNIANVPNLYLRTDLLKAGYGTYRLLSGCPECESPIPSRKWSLLEMNPALVGASADFSHVVFESTDNLTRQAFGTKPKLYESVNGVVRLVGILPNGSVAEESVAGKGASTLVFAHEGMYTPRAVATDGSRILFTVPSGSAGEPGSLYLRENGATTVQVNASERATPEPEQPAEFLNATPDGKKIFFATAQALTDDDTHPGVDLYMYDVNATAHHHLTLLTPSNLGGPEAQVEAVTGVSDDGSYVYFALLLGLEKELYVWHDGALRHIANAHYYTPWGNTPAFQTDLFRVTPGGKRVMFASDSRSTAESVGYDNCRPEGGCEGGSLEDLRQEVYVYDYGTGRLTCVSCDPSGERPMGNAGFMSNSDDISKMGITMTQHLNRAMSSDGSKVFFDTPDPLVRQDTNGKRDVYEYDMATGKVSLISSGRSSDDSLFVEATPDGSDVFFTTGEQLVRADVDGNFDLYDARVGGGIPSQNVAPPAQCESDDCQGPTKASPVFSLPSSRTFEGAGNPVSASKRTVSRRAKSPMRTTRLRHALRRCRREHGRKRRMCERLAHRRFGAVKSSTRTVAVAGRGR